MNDILSFVTANWFLCSVFMILLVTVVSVEMHGSVRGIPQLNPQQTVVMMNRDNAIVLDVRDSNDYMQGHITEAKSMPLKKFNIGDAALQKSKTQPVVVYC